MHRTLSLGIATLAGAAACTAPPESLVRGPLVCRAPPLRTDAGPTTTGTTVLDFCHAYNRAVTRRFSDCYGGTTEQWMTVLSATYLMPDTWCTQLEPLVSSGRVSLDGQACVDALDGECGEDFPPPCYVWTVLAAEIGLSDGEDCSLSRWLCGPGFYCADRECPPRCKSKPMKAGAACSLDASWDPCPLGTLCDFSDRTCIRLPGLGEPCFGVNICGGGTFCNQSTHLCKTPRTVGAQCDDHDQCERGLLCLGEEKSMSCQPANCLAKRVGESCAIGERECSDVHSDSFFFLRCGSSERCVFEPGLGEECGDIGGDRPHCVDGFCPVKTGPGTAECVAKKPAGAPCGDDAECIGFSCAAGACAPPACLPH